MNIILLGAPGAGKGTQAEKICEYCHIPLISTGNIIRAAMKNGTEAGQKAQEFVHAGKLVPDAVVIEMVNERLKQDDCKNGFILDGFPRTVPQAQALQEMGVEIDHVIDIEVPDETIMQRLTGRRVCGECGASYHIINNPPKVENVCDKCGHELIIRKDAHPDTVKDRLQVYHEQTEPLKDFYEKRGLLYMIEGTRPVEQVTKDVLNALGVQSALEA